MVILVKFGIIEIYKNTKSKINLQNHYYGINGINKINVNIFNVFSGEYTKEPDVTKFYCNLNTNNLTKDGYISAIHIPSMKIYKQKIIDIIK